MLAQQIL